VIDRLLVFSNPEVLKLLKEKFISVAANDWYQRRRQDAEGEFLYSISVMGKKHKTPFRHKQWVGKEDIGRHTVKSFTRGAQLPNNIYHLAQIRFYGWNCLDTPLLTTLRFHHVRSRSATITQLPQRRKGWRRVGGF
jgi:hypothetical protein